MNDLMHELETMKGRQWLDECINKLRADMRTLETESAAEMCKQCRPKTKTRRNNLTIVEDAELNDETHSEYLYQRNKFPWCCMLGLIPAYNEGITPDDMLQ